MFRAEIWGTVADWAGAIASASASVVALWIALRSERSRVTVEATVSPKVPSDGSVEGIRVFIANRGFTRIDVIHVVGLWGLFWPRDVLLGAMLADRQTVEHGEYAAPLIDWRRFSQFEEYARRKRPLWFLERLFPRSVRVGVLLSTGEYVYAPAVHVMKWVRSRPVELDPSLPAA